MGRRARSTTPPRRRPDHPPGPPVTPGGRADGTHRPPARRSGAWSPAPRPAARLPRRRSRGCLLAHGHRRPFRRPRSRAGHAARAAHAPRRAATSPCRGDVPRRRRRRGRRAPRGPPARCPRPARRPRPCRSSRRPRPRPAQSTARRAPSAGVRVPRPRTGGGRLVQILPNEAVDVAVENTLGVADLEPGAMVLDPLVGMEEVAADLRAPLRGLLLTALPGELLGALELLPLEKPRAQDLHGRRLVLSL